MKSSLKKIKTCYLVEELESREGVEAHNINNNEDYIIHYGDAEEGFAFINETGPAIILVITD